MNILMVSPFPPLRDGVGRYAAQEVASLRREGHDVEVLAPIACAAHYVENFKKWMGGLAKLRGYARRYDRVILQYQPAHFHRKSEGPARIVSNFWMMVAFRTIPNLEIVCHEIEHPAPAWPRWRPEVAFDRWAWSGARHVEFHTAHELEQMQTRLGVTPRHTELRAHGRYFRPSVTEDRTEARRRLGLPASVPILLCIGFISPHKGFDRAVRAFRRVPGDARLFIVGSVWAETHAHRGYVRELNDLAAADERIQVRERMVSDEEFDRWIVASDVVILPYREIWSSGVVERARVLDRPVIASAVGGMPEQLRGDDRMVAGDEELAKAISDVVGGGPPAEPGPMTVRDAIAYVADEARRRGVLASGTSIDRALHDLRSSRGVKAITLPSSRRYIGRLVDIVKRVLRRGFGWLLTPMLGQVNYYQDLTLEAFEEILSLMRRELDDDATLARRFYDDPDSVLSRLGTYVERFRDCGTVVHLGAGRGTALELLRERGIDARGVDPRGDVVAGAQAAGSDVEEGEAVSFLLGSAPASISCLIVSRVEDLSASSLEELHRAARTAMRPDGVFVLEGMDRRQAPGEATQLASFAERAGFVDVELRHWPTLPRREAIDVGSEAPEWAHRLAKTLEEEFATLYRLSVGPAGHVIVARVPTA